jgi:hypothetical protein
MLLLRINQVRRLLRRQVASAAAGSKRSASMTKTKLKAMDDDDDEDEEYVEEEEDDDDYFAGGKIRKGGSDRRARTAAKAHVIRQGQGRALTAARSAAAASDHVDLRNANPPPLVLRIVTARQKSMVSKLEQRDQERKQYAEEVRYDKRVSPWSRFGLRVGFRLG